MPFDGYQKIEDAMHAGVGDNYEGAETPCAFLMRVTREELLAMAAEADDDGVWFMLDRVGERGMQGRKTLLRPHWRSV